MWKTLELEEDGSSADAAGRDGRRLSCFNEFRKVRFATLLSIFLCLSRVKVEGHTYRDRQVPTRSREIVHS